MDNNTTSGGIGFASALQLIFITLKLLKVISWKWVWVLAPTWISCIAVIILILVLVIIHIREDRKWRKK